MQHAVPVVPSHPVLARAARLAADVLRAHGIHASVEALATAIEFAIPPVPGVTRCAARHEMGCDCGVDCVLSAERVGGETP